MSKSSWGKRLSPAAKAEMLAATFHELTDHQPEIWKTVPEWLRARIKQAMHDCSIDAHDLTMEEMQLCVRYGKWLNKKHRVKKKRYLHFAYISSDEGGVGQYGCAWATSLEEAKEQSDPREVNHLVRMKTKDCPLCKANKEENKR
jgi:hypothetical protein